MVALPESKGIPAEIKMQTVLVQDGEVEKHLFEEKGRLLHMNGSYYIRYEETSGETPVPVIVKVTPDGKVSLIRQGETTTRLRFDIDKRTQSGYQVPTGMIQIQIETTDLKISYYDRPFSGRVFVDYALYLGEQKLGEYQIRLHFTT